MTVFSIGLIQFIAILDCNVVVLAMGGGVWYVTSKSCSAGNGALDLIFLIKGFVKRLAVWQNEALWMVLGDRLILMAQVRVLHVH